MTIWALSDLHLSFGITGKKMDVFGQQWQDHSDKIREQWISSVAPDDLVLIPGDISWAMSLEEARVDLLWIDSLPGTKVIIRGNHDYWWSSTKKLMAIMPASVHFIHNNAYNWNDASITGTRLWDSPDFSFNEFIHFVDTEGVSIKKNVDVGDQKRKIFERELIRLEIGLKALNPKAKKRIVMTHFPPVDGYLNDSPISKLLEKYNVTTCVFGHLHNLLHDKTLFGEKNGIEYVFASCDYLSFAPVKIA